MRDIVYPITKLNEKNQLVLVDNHYTTHENIFNEHRELILKNKDIKYIWDLSGIRKWESYLLYSFNDKDTIYPWWWTTWNMTLLSVNYLWKLYFPLVKRDTNVSYWWKYSFPGWMFEWNLSIREESFLEVSEEIFFINKMTNQLSYFKSKDINSENSIIKHFINEDKKKGEKHRENLLRKIHSIKEIKLNPIYKSNGIWIINENAPKEVLLRRIQKEQHEVLKLPLGHPTYFKVWKSKKDNIYNIQYLFESKIEYFHNPYNLIPLNIETTNLYGRWFNYKELIKEDIPFKEKITPRKS